MAQIGRRLSPNSLLPHTNILQELSGWSEPTMVQRYAHLSPEHIAEYTDKTWHKFGTGNKKGLDIPT